MPILANAQRRRRAGGGIELLDGAGARRAARRMVRPLAALPGDAFPGAGMAAALGAALCAGPVRRGGTPRRGQSGGAGAGLRLAGRAAGSRAPGPATTATGCSRRAEVGEYPAGRAAGGALRDLRPDRSAADTAESALLSAFLPEGGRTERPDEACHVTPLLARMGSRRRRESAARTGATRCGGSIASAGWWRWCPG